MGAMLRELLLLRHAKSAWGTDAPTDFERPLAARGQRDAPRMGTWIRENDVVPDHVVSSPARRAAETVHLMVAEMGVDEETIVFVDEIYDAAVSDLLDVLADCPAARRRVLLVGHNPALEDLVEHLAGRIDAPQGGKVFPTAALAHLVMPDDWSRLPRACAELRSLTRPRALRA
jgi:phosphohistidine phosphatase